MSPCLFTDMQRTSCKTPSSMSHRLESRLEKYLNKLRYADDTILMAESKEELKNFLMRVKEESEKAG